MNDDDRLKEGFAKLRADDARRAPPFERMYKARPRRSPWVFVAPAVSMAAAAAAILIWCGTRPEAGPLASAPLAPVAPVGPAAAGGVGGGGAADGVRGVAGEAAPAPPDDPAPLDFLLDVPMAGALARVPDFDTTLLQGKSR